MDLFLEKTFIYTLLSPTRLAFPIMIISTLGLASIYFGVTSPNTQHKK